MNIKLLRLRIGSIDTLTRYVATQVNNLFPDKGVDNDIEQIAGLVPKALERMLPILESVLNYTPGFFDHFNSLQYASFLYLLSNEQWLSNRDETILAERLFCLNKALNTIDLFYSVKMPEIFFLSHGHGVTLGNVTYGNRLVIFQNVTVGRVGSHRPCIGNNVVLYPGAVVTGKSVIGNGCVIGAGSVLHGVEIPDNTVAIMRFGELKLKPIGTRKYICLYLR